MLDGMPVEGGRKVALRDELVSKARSAAPAAKGWSSERTGSEKSELREGSPKPLSASGRTRRVCMTEACRDPIMYEPHIRAATPTALLELHGHHDRHQPTVPQSCGTTANLKAHLDQNDLDAPAEPNLPEPRRSRGVKVPSMLMLRLPLCIMARCRRKKRTDEGVKEQRTSTTRRHKTKPTRSTQVKRPKRRQGARPCTTGTDN